MVARFHGMEKVRGSNPLSSTSSGPVSRHGRPALNAFTATSRGSIRAPSAVVQPVRPRPDGDSHRSRSPGIGDGFSDPSGRPVHLGRYLPQCLPAAGEILVDLADAFMARHPEARAQVVLEAEIGEPLRPLREGRIDMLATHLPVRESDLVVGPVVLLDQLMPVASAAHPLAARSEVSIEHLYEQPVVAASPMAPSYWRDHFLPPLTPSGKLIEPAHYVDSIQAGLALCEAGKGIGLIAKQFARYNQRPGLVYLPLIDAPAVEVALVWSTDRQSKLGSAFAELAEEYGPVEG